MTSKFCNYLMLNLRALLFFRLFFKSYEELLKSYETSNKEGRLNNMKLLFYLALTE